MHYIVCIKQVPGTTAVDIDEATGALKREGVESKINPYDLYALEFAFRLREKTGGIVTALSMGPPQAERALREALTLGADAAVLLTDHAFAGADVLATSYALSQAVRTLGDYQLILCGKQTTDGDTAQVGAALAEHLGIPHAAWVNEARDIDNDGITVRHDLSEHYIYLRMRFPCLITVDKGDYAPRLPSYLRKRRMEGVSVKTLVHTDLPDADSRRYGADGSPTRVERIFPPAANTGRTLLKGEPDELAAAVARLLAERKIIVREGA